MKYPLDRTAYPKDPKSAPLQVGISDGGYVYVRDVQGVIHVTPDGPHLHPKVLGGGLPATYAGDMTVRRGRISDLTNLSGTFQFDDPDGLLDVAQELERLGFLVGPGAVRLFPLDGSRPVVLR